MLGTINHTLQTLIAAAAFGDGLAVAGIVLNRIRPAADDPSIATNGHELAARCVAEILATVEFQAEQFDGDVDWYHLAES